MSRDKSISQRWTEEFYQQSKEIAKIANLSATQLTVDSILLMGEMLDFQKIRDLYPSERRDFIRKAVAFYIDSRQRRFDEPIYREPVEEPEDVQKPVVTSTHRRTLSKTEQIMEFLRTHEGERFTTVEIAERLNMVQSTTRTYVKKLCEDDDKFVLITGRPNKVYYRRT